MDLPEKGAILIQHWIQHSEAHLLEYEALAADLESAGMAESARCIREMMALTVAGSEWLRKALQGNHSLSPPSMFRNPLY